MSFICCKYLQRREPSHQNKPASMIYTPVLNLLAPPTLSKVIWIKWTHFPHKVLKSRGRKRRSGWWEGMWFGTKRTSWAQTCNVISIWHLPEPSFNISGGSSLRLENLGIGVSRQTRRGGWWWCGTNTSCSLRSKLKCLCWPYLTSCCFALWNSMNPKRRRGKNWTARG